MSCVVYVIEIWRFSAVLGSAEWQYCSITIETRNAISEGISYKLY